METFAGARRRHLRCSGSCVRVLCAHSPPSPSRSRKPGRLLNSFRARRALAITSCCERSEPGRAYSRALRHSGAAGVPVFLFRSLLLGARLGAHMLRGSLQGPPPTRLVHWRLVSPASDPGPLHLRPPPPPILFTLLISHIMHNAHQYHRSVLESVLSYDLG